MFEYFLAKKYIKTKHKINLITIISILSTIGITIGVAALIVVISVFNGFGDLVTQTLINFDPHIRISVLDAEINQKEIETQLKEIKHITAVSGYTEGKVIIYNNRNYNIVTLKGISSEQEDWGISKTLYRGEFNPSKTSGLPEVVLNLATALRIGAANIGDTIQVMSFNDLKKSVTGFSLLRSRKFVVAGFFETNNKDYDLKYIFTSTKNAQKTLRKKNQLSGYEIRLDDIENSNKVKAELEKVFDDEKLSINTWYDLHKDLYTMMKVERWSGFIILCLIIAVATFNILGSLTMSVIEKKKDIGILKAMGATDKMIMRIFMYEGILIGVLGTFLGVGIGLTICFIQNQFGIYSLDVSKYIVQSLPLTVNYFDILIIAFTSIALSSVASLYPAKRAVKVSIIDVIKWE